jgi:hypothetical protein
MRGRSDGRVVFLLRAAIVCTVLMLRPLSASAAPILLGDSVQATLNTPGTIVTQFTSPAVVGSGVEFTGAVRDPGKTGTLWNVTVDISATSFTIGFTSFPDAFIASFGPLLTLSLSGLDFTPAGLVTGVTRTGYSCAAPGVVCDNGAPADANLSFTDHSLSVDFFAFRHGETYTFDIAASEPVAPTPVPEPTSLALLGSGFATFIAGRDRQRQRSSALGGTALRSKD